MGPALRNWKPICSHCYGIEEHRNAAADPSDRGVFSRFGDAVVPQAAAVMGRRSPPSALPSVAYSAGLVLSVCALAWLRESDDVDPRIEPMFQLLLGLARSHAESAAIAKMVFPLERLQTL